MNYYGDDLQRFYGLQRRKPGMLRNWRGIVKITLIGVVSGAIWAAIASSCSMHHTWTPVATQQPGVIMEFKPVTVEPMPNVVPAIDLDEQETFSI